MRSLPGFAWRPCGRWEFPRGWPHPARQNFGMGQSGSPRRDHRVSSEGTPHVVPYKQRTDQTCMEILITWFVLLLVGFGFGFVGGAREPIGGVGLPVFRVAAPVGESIFPRGFGFLLVCFDASQGCFGSKSFAWIVFVTVLDAAKTRPERI